MRGRFVTLEGPEGAGKTTHAATLAQRLRTGGLEVVELREPGGTHLGEVVRRILKDDVPEELLPEAELLLFAASRAQLVRQVVAPALDAGAWVVCDRFVDSTTVYQGDGRGLDREALAAINAFAVGPVRPDLTLLLDVDVNESLDRIQRRSVGGGPLDRIERESREFHERVRNGYLELAATEPDRVRVIRCDRTQEETARMVWEVVSNVFDIGS